MTRDEALATWTHCRQVSKWKDNYSPEENDGLLARKLMSKAYDKAVIQEVKELGMWPSREYSAVVRVFLPQHKSDPDANAVIVPEKHLLYLAVRKEG